MQSQAAQAPSVDCEVFPVTRLLEPGSLLAMPNGIFIVVMMDNRMVRALPMTDAFLVEAWFSTEFVQLNGRELRPGRDLQEDDRYYWDEVLYPNLVRAHLRLYASTPPLEYGNLH